MRSFVGNLLVAVGCLSVTLSGCGYTLRTSRTPHLEREGIRKIYIQPLVNNSYTIGVENIVYNALVRAFTTYQRVRLVTRPEDADAILSGVVTDSNYTAGASKVVNDMNPSGLGRIFAAPDMKISQEYVATLSCSFSLLRAEPKQQAPTPAAGNDFISRALSIPSQPLPVGKALWSASFGRNKVFPALNQLDVLGTTSALINDSEFVRSTRELAASMTTDVHESMLSMF
jgi:hypothetical protein